MADQKITDLAELTAPAAADLLPIVDDSEATAANKNKRIQYSVFLRNLPNGTVGAPSLAWTSDAGVTGLYRTAANETAFTNNSTFIGKFTTTGFQLGTGTAAAQLHLFSTDTTDQVIIENTDAGLDTAPDVVLYRNSASPAADDNLGNLVFRGEDSGGNAHDYAQILASINSPTDGAEVGTLDLMTASSGVPTSRIRLDGVNVGIHEASPNFPLHITSTIASTALNVEASVDDTASAADITLLHLRGDTTAGQDDDLLSTVYYRGHNDAGTPEQIDYAAVEGSIADASDGTEDGRLRFKVQTAGTITTQLEINANTIGFFGATAAAQSSHVADITTTATTGTLPTADGSVTIADAASPTNAELLEYCVELEAKVEALLAFASAHGLMASS